MQAETLATAQLAVKRSKDEPVPAFEAGLEYKLLISVSVLCQGGTDSKLPDSAYDCSHSSRARPHRVLPRIRQSRLQTQSVAIASLFRVFPH